MTFLNTEELQWKNNSVKYNNSILPFKVQFLNLQQKSTPSLFPVSNDKVTYSKFVNDILIKCKNYLLFRVVINCLYSL